MTASAENKSLRYILSPEFHRHLWLNFSLFRLLAGIAVPVLWGMSFGAESMTTLFFFVVILWGCYESATALRDEVKGKTWDFLRMSSISPAALSLGKLFGATSYVWYMGLITLPFFILVSKAGIALPSLFNNLQTVFFMVMIALIGHATAFLVSFGDMNMQAGKGGKNRLPRVAIPFIIGLVVSISLFSGVVVPMQHSLWMRTLDIYWQQAATWYGNAQSAKEALMMGMLFTLFWLLFGAYRLAQAELMYRMRPFAWMAFMASLLVYLGGFSLPNGVHSDVQIFLLFLLSLGIAYGMLLLEAGDGRQYARFVQALKVQDWQRGFENTPKWVVTIPFVLVMYGVAMSSATTTFSTLGAFMTALILFAVRDGLVIHAVQRGGEGKHTAFKLLFYYLLVYGFFPILQMSGATAQVIRSVVRYVQYGTEVPSILKALAFYYPLPLQSLSTAILPVIGEILLIGGLLYWRLHSKPKKMALENV